MKIDIISFDGFVKYGLENGANVVDGMPWHFKYKGIPVSHENDNHYLVMPTNIPNGGLINFKRGEVLIINYEVVSTSKDVILLELVEQISDLKRVLGEHHKWHLDFTDVPKEFVGINMALEYSYSEMCDRTVEALR